jgi:hypothetical protein
MTWRNPRYCYLHAARDAGAAAITDNSHGWLSTHPKDFLIDNRAGSLATFDSSESDHWIQIDRGAGSLHAINRLLIPSGHNLAGTTLTVKTGAADPPTTTRLTSGAIVAGLISEGVTQNSDQYVRLEITGTGAWAIPELIYSYTETTDRGPEQGWVDMIRHNTLDYGLESGAVASLSLGADRRFIEYVYRDVKLAADLTAFADLITTCGTSRPFYLDPCFTTESPIWMKLTEDSRQMQDPELPAFTDSTQRQIRLSMLEHLA